MHKIEDLNCIRDRGASQHNLLSLTSCLQSRISNEGELQHFSWKTSSNFFISFCTFAQKKLGGVIMSNNIKINPKRKIYRTLKLIKTYTFLSCYVCHKKLIIFIIKQSFQQRSLFRSSKGCLWAQVRLN